MSATVVFPSTAEARVVPGQQVRLQARIGNIGTQVDAIRLDVVGLPDGWARVEPAEVRLLPEQHATVEVILAPPRASSSAAGSYVLGLRADCREDAEEGFVEEATLEVLPFTDVAAELVPRTRRARGLRSREYVVAVDNRSNVPITVDVDAVDPDQNLVLAVKRPTLDCPPGSANFAPLRVRGRRRYWRGPVASKGFSALVSVAGAPEPYRVPGTFEHAALVPQVLPRLLSRSALIAAGLAAVFLVVLRPQAQTVQRAITAASSKEVAAPSQSQITQANQQAAAAAAAAAAAERAAQQATQALKAKPKPTPAATPLAPALPFSQRLAVVVNNYAPFYRVAPNQELSLRGFVLQPNDDRGVATLLRSGQVLVTARLGDTTVYTLPAPLVFGPGSTAQFSVLCQDDVGQTCTAAVLLVGTLRTLPVKPLPTPTPFVTAPAPNPQPYTAPTS